MRRVESAPHEMPRTGFTLIELLIVMGIIGILAAIAVPRYLSTRERAFVSVMQADLNQVRTAQELYNRTGAEGYADNIEDLPSFQPSEGVTVTLLDRGDKEWAGEARHTGTDQICIYESTVGTMTCDPGLDPNDDPSPDDDPGDGASGGDDDEDIGEEGGGGLFK